MSNNEHIQAIHEIRQMMNKSARFLSLSGLSGVSAGIYAIIAGVIAYNKLSGLNQFHKIGEHKSYFIMLAAVTIILAIVSAFIFTKRKAQKNGVKIWDDTIRKAMINLSIPLVTGGVFCLSLLQSELYGYLAPSTLLFYGLALVNVSRYTFPLIRQLGILEIILGLINSFFLGYGLVFWIIGFGVLHIFYGAYMYIKFDRE